MIISGVERGVPSLDSVDTSTVLNMGASVPMRFSANFEYSGFSSIPNQV